MATLSSTGQIMKESAEASAYISQKLEQLQNGIVNVRSASSRTIDASIWISRNTVCDVISVVTTIAPIKNGDMNDIRQHNKEMKRIRAPISRVPGKMLPGNPLEEGQIVDHEKNHIKNCSLLRKERKEFMDKLRTSRYIRTVVENGAATTIQKAFRRFAVFLNWHIIKEECIIHQRIRSVLKTCLLAKQHAPLSELEKQMLLTPAQHRENYRKLRFSTARKIQCCFRTFMSRRTIRQRRFEAIILKRRSAAVKIQCMARKFTATALVKLLRTRRKISRYTRSVLLIQTRVRMMFARRMVRKTRLKFRHIAARIIQCWYRAMHSKWKTSKLKELIIKEKRFIGALGLQGIVRRKVAYNRVYRLRLRRIYLFVFFAALRIQSAMRRRLCIMRVRRVRAEKLQIVKGRELKAKVVEAAVKSQADAEAAEQASKDAMFNDIYVQLREGNVKRFEDIFHGAGGACQARDPTYVDKQGNSLLTLSAAYGHIELVKKCSGWLFDLNHRNNDGFNALMLAVKHDRHDVIQYFLSPEVKIRLNPTALIRDDGAFLLIAAIESLNRSMNKSERKEQFELLKSLLGTHGLVSSINVKDSRYSGMTPFHMAALGSVHEVFLLLLKSRPQTDILDDLGHTALQKACMSRNGNVDIIKALLGLDSSSGIVVPEPKRATLVTKTDLEGKNCLLLAALAGQTTALTFLQDFLQQDVHSSAAPQNSVTWTDANILSTLELAESGNDSCLEYIFQSGFDPKWATKDSKMTLSMAACKFGHLIFVNALLNRGVPFLEQKDSKGQTAMHYAAMCPAASTLIPHLLIHEKARDCGISEMSLAVQDDEGYTPLHTAAKAGIEIGSIDLLARRGIEKALLTRDNTADGLTPLLVAAKYRNKNVIALYLTMSGDAKIADKNGRYSLWWFFHSEIAAISEVTSSSRPPSSEFLSRRGLQSKMNKKDRDDAALALQTDIDTIKALLNAGCPLYLKHNTTAEDMLSLQFDSKGINSSPESRLPFDAGDLLVQELSITALKEVTAVLTVDDAWRLVVGCIRFDDGTSKALLTFLESGGGDMLAKIPIRAKYSEKSVSQLEKDYFFDGMTLAAWCIKLGNNAALRLLLKNRYDFSLSVLQDCKQSCLHLAAIYGTNVMVETILEDPRVRIEAENHREYTPLMEAASIGNFQTAKRLVVNKACARRGIDGKYWGWLLAFARKQEKFEKNLQTGRIGDDDDRYFRVRVPGWMLLAMRK